MKPGYYISGLLLALFILSACRTNNPGVQERDLSDIYNPSRSTLNPSYTLYHVNDSNSVIYIRVFPAELLFSQANEQGQMLAKLKISYRISQAGENLTEIMMTDSGSTIKTLNRNEVRNSFFSAIPVKAFKGSRYIAEVKLRDELRGSFNIEYLLVDRTSDFNAQNFRVLSSRTNYPAFTEHFNSQESFKLAFNRIGFDTILVDYYSPDRSMPRPVFSNTPEIPLRTVPDSSWYMPFSDTAIYSLETEGMYHLRMNSESKVGLTLFNFGTNFPRTLSPDDMLGPLVYLTSTAEFRDLRLQPNRKLAIDNFWLGTTTSMESAKELIKVYYNRVLFSNLNFTSHKEGWKTDRGMIYIIFGPPAKLEKSFNQEKWIYFSRRSSSPVEFIFDRKINMFTDRDFQLQRSTSSISLWTQAVQSWRKGRIYTTEI